MQGESVQFSAAGSIGLLKWYLDGQQLTFNGALNDRGVPLAISVMPTYTAAEDVPVGVHVLELAAVPITLAPGATADKSYTTLTVVLAVARLAGATVADGTTATLRFVHSQGKLYSYDFDGDGNFDVVDSASPTAALPAYLTADGPITRAVAGRITDADGSSVDYSATITVANAAPGGTLVFSGSTVTFAAPNSGPPDVAADLPGLRYSFDFASDGVYEIADSADNTAAIPDNYFVDRVASVTVTARDKDGGITKLAGKNGGTDRVTTAKITGATTVAENVALRLLATSSFAGASTAIARYEWDSDYDGVTFVPRSTGTVLVASDLDGPSTRQVALRVTDSAANVSVATATVKVTNAAPAFSVNVSGRTALVVKSGSSAFDVPGDVLTLSHDFDDDGRPDLVQAQPDPVLIPLNFIPANGLVHARVTVTDDDPHDNLAEYPLTVQFALPSAVITADAPTIDEGGRFTSPARRRHPEATTPSRRTSGTPTTMA